MPEYTPEEIAMYELANDIKFITAIHETEKEIFHSSDTKYINDSIKNRVALIKNLKEAGYKIEKI